MVRKAIRLFCCLTALVLCGADATSHACPMDLPGITARVNGHTLSLAVAASPEARRCGLSERDRLPEDEGMLFVLPAPRMFSFWMKNTRLPLSIAFLDEEGRILSIEQMAPLNADAIYSSPGPVRFAVEVNQGWYAAHGVRVGDVIRFALPGGLRIQ